MLACIFFIYIERLHAVYTRIYLNINHTQKGYNFLKARTSLEAEQQTFAVTIIFNSGDIITYTVYITKLRRMLSTALFLKQYA